MAKSLYIASLEPRAGKSVVALGLMELLSARVERLAYFRPVVPEAADVRSALIQTRFPAARVAYAYTAEEVEDLLADGRNDDVYRGILESYRGMTRDADFVLCDGTDYTGVS
ncbi:MAG TPA: AAA family ATPase, partial [Acidimicrobiia bacterium]